MRGLGAYCRDMTTWRKRLSRLWAGLSLLLPIALVGWSITTDMPGAVPAETWVRVGCAAEALAWAALTLYFVAKALSYRRYAGWRCARCGYDRRGLSRSAPCPECGEGGRRPMMPLTARHDSRDGG
jgi:hypothetical protein